MHQIGGELDNVVEAGARRFERGLDIGERLDALCVKIVYPDRRAARIDGHLTRDKKKLGRLNPRHVRVLAERLAERVGIKKRKSGGVALCARGGVATLTDAASPAAPVRTYRRDAVASSACGQSSAASILSCMMFSPSVVAGRHGHAVGHSI